MLLKKAQEQDYYVIVWKRVDRHGADYSTLDGGLAPKLRTYNYLKGVMIRGWKDYERRLKEWDEYIADVPKWEAEYRAKHNTHSYYFNNMEFYRPNRPEDFSMVMYNINDLKTLDNPITIQHVLEKEAEIELEKTKRRRKKRT